MKGTEVARMRRERKGMNGIEGNAEDGVMV
jgi:hypothetical protein